MFRRVFPLVFAACVIGGFTACGGESADELAEEQAKLDEKQAKIEELEGLQKKRANGTITSQEEVRLHNLYVELDNLGENPEEN